MHGQPTPTPEPAPAAATPEDIQMVNVNKIQPKLKQDQEEREDDENIGLCVTCVKSKLWWKFARKPVEQAKKPFELIYSDLCGPINPPLIAGARYFIVYIDDYSRLCSMYFLHTKTAEEVVS